MKTELPDSGVIFKPLASSWDTILHLKAMEMGDKHHRPNRPVPINFITVIAAEVGQTRVGKVPVVWGAIALARDDRRSEMLVAVELVVPQEPRAECVLFLLRTAYKMAYHAGFRRLRIACAGRKLTIELTHEQETDVLHLLRKHPRLEPCASSERVARELESPRVQSDNSWA